MRIRNKNYPINTRVAFPANIELSNSSLTIYSWRVRTAWYLMRLETRFCSNRSNSCSNGRRLQTAASRCSYVTVVCSTWHRHCPIYLPYSRQLHKSLSSLIELVALWTVDFDFVIITRFLISARFPTPPQLTHSLVLTYASKYKGCGLCILALSSHFS